MSKCRSAVFAVMVIFAAACSSSTDGGAVPNIISVTNNAFSPSTRTIGVGGTVTWSWNSAGTLHNVTFAGVAGAPANITDAGSGSFPRTFNTAGTFNFSCTIHGAPMNGTITVTP
jgi:plastocyanin